MKYVQLLYSNFQVLIKSRLPVILVLACSLLNCTQRIKDADSKSVEDTYQKDTSLLLLAFMDSVAHQMEGGNYSLESLKKITERFSINLPLTTSKKTFGRSSDSIYVGIYIYDSEPYTNTVSIYAPDILKRNLDFDKIAERFGPIVPEDENFPRPKMPRPVWLDLSKYLGNKSSEVSFVISAKDFGTATSNDIRQIEITNTKLMEMRE